MCTCVCEYEHVVFVFVCVRACGTCVGMSVFGSLKEGAYTAQRVNSNKPLPYSQES